MSRVNLQLGGEKHVEGVAIRIEYTSLIDNHCKRSWKGAKRRRRQGEVKAREGDKRDTDQSPGSLALASRSRPAILEYYGLSHDGARVLKTGPNWVRGL